MRTTNARARPERRVVSVWLPRFATDLRVRREQAAASGGNASPASANGHGDPLVTVAEANGQVVLAAVDRRAAAADLVPGLPLADARALVPNLRTAAAD
ncbi:MAG: hypothetical protein VW405_21815, partial [Rhodospirillaceae bacterium]